MSDFQRLRRDRFGILSKINRYITLRCVAMSERDQSHDHVEDEIEEVVGKAGEFSIFRNSW